MDVCPTCGQPLPQPAKRLTNGELDALSAWWITKSVHGAAQMLRVSDRTVTNHLYNARTRHGIHKTVELVQLHFGHLRSADAILTQQNSRKREAA